MKFKEIINNISGGFAYICFNFAPMLAPVPSLWRLIIATGGSPASWMVALVLEMMGFGAGDSLVRAFHRQTMPRWIAISIFSLYMVAVEGVIVGYESLPVFTEWLSGRATEAQMIQAFVPVVFPLFTVAGALMASVLLQQIETESLDREMSSAKASIDLELYRMREMAKVEAKYGKKSDSSGDSPESKADSSDDAILRFYAGNPKASQRQDDLGAPTPEGAANELYIPKVYKVD